MKLVINTQYRENYGAHDWNGEGACPQYWKNKFGNTYIIEGIDVKKFSDFEREEMPKLQELLEYSNNMSENFIIGYSIENNNKKCHEEYEVPIYLIKENDKWIGHSVTINDYYSGLNRNISEKREKFVLKKAGEMEDYISTYLLTNGKVVKYDELEKEINEIEKKKPKI